MLPVSSVSMANRSPVRRETAEMLVFGGLACLGTSLAGVWPLLMARRIEMEVPIMVLLTVWRAGVPIMTLNGKSQVMLFLIVMCALSHSPVWAAGTIIMDNFNDENINTSIWRNLDDDPIGENYPFRYPVERNGHLEIYNDGTQDDAAGLRTQINIPVEAYFQAQVSFNTSECAEQSGLFFSVHNFTTDYDHAVQYAMIANAVWEGRKWLVMKSSGTGDEDPVIEASESTLEDIGAFYITYDGGTIHFSHTGYGEENAICTVNISDWTDCTQVWLALTAWSNGTLLSGSGSYFDDFYLAIPEAELLHPLHLGLRYAYNRTDGDGVTNWTVAREFIEKMTANSMDYYRLRSWNYDNDGQYEVGGYLRSTQNAVYSYNPSDDDLQFQAAPVGTTWTLYEEHESGLNYKVIEIVAIEEVTVPYGTFWAYKHRRYRHNNTGDNSPYWYEWIVPGVGIIKEEDYWVEEGQTAPMVMELISISITGDFCGPSFGPPDGYVDVWDLMQFAEHWHTRTGEGNWDAKFDLAGPSFAGPDGYIDVWDLIAFADHWHEGEKP